MEGTPFGRYLLSELLGRGGMGEVWRASDTAANNRTVAIKLLPPHLAGDATFVQRFRREADAAAQLNNPHIIPIHNYGEIDGQLYVDMRLIEGRDLQDTLTDGPLPPARAVHIVEHVAKALHAAHKVGLVHRDVKPSNILLDDDDFGYLIDFGIARAVDDTRLTGTGNAIGTFSYIAPERLADNSDDDGRGDVYALACVLYECLTGKPPFAGTSMVSLVAAHLHTAPPQPSTTHPNVPPAFDDVIANGMAKDPDGRYATTLELAHAARAALTQPVPRSEPTRMQRPAVTEYRTPPTQLGPPVQPPPNAGPQWSASAPQPLTLPERPWWRRNALALLAVAVVAVAAVSAAAILVGNDGAGTNSGSKSPPSASPTVSSGSIRPVRVSVFSPDGQPDSPDLASLAIDGNPLTAWHTDVYTSPSPFPEFKSGVGLMLQLGQPAVLGAVTIDVSSVGTVVEIRSAQSALSSALQDTVPLTPPTPLTSGPNTIKIDPATRTSNVLVWISTLGTTAGVSQAAISEITLQGPT